MKNVILLIGLFLVGITFNNFTRWKPTAQFHQNNASLSLSEKTKGFAQILQKTLPEGFCENSQNYSCLQKIFSSQNIKTENQSLPCVKLLQGGEICPQGRTLSYNSEAAARACGSDCHESYDYEESNCHLKLRRPGEEIYPLVVTEDSLTNAIEKLHQNCLQIKGDLAQ